MFTTLAIVAFTLAALTSLYLVSRQWGLHQLAQKRMYEEGTATPATAVTFEDATGLRRWLGLAGFRQPSASLVFLVASVLLGLLGVVLVLALVLGGNFRAILRALAQIPGGVGDLLVPLVWAAPWLLPLLLATLPWYWVQMVRRRRVRQMEEDMPITFELLATLGEAGIGFDAALERVLSAQPAHRPLTQEFRTFQAELLAGRSRIQCLRRLGRRIHLTSFTIFVSALVQAEQVGAASADVLRRQAEDQRASRRERALALAASLPVKLLFPLVVCFLPGILVATLGPTLFQVFQLLEGLSRR